MTRWWRVWSTDRDNGSDRSGGNDRRVSKKSSEGHTNESGNGGCRATTLNECYTTIAVYRMLDYGVIMCLVVVMEVPYFGDGICIEQRRRC